MDDINPKPDKQVVAKRTCPPMLCGGNPDLSGNQTGFYQFEYRISNKEYRIMKFMFFPSEKVERLLRSSQRFNM